MSLILRGVNNEEMYYFIWQECFRFCCFEIFQFGFFAYVGFVFKLVFFMIANWLLFVLGLYFFFVYVQWVRDKNFFLIVDKNFFFQFFLVNLSFMVISNQQLLEIIKCELFKFCCRRNDLLGRWSCFEEFGLGKIYFWSQGLKEFYLS